MVGVSSPADPWTDATGLAEAVRNGQATPKELVEAALARRDATRSLGAFVHDLDDTARRMADGPLPDGPFRGVPIAIKDFDGFVAGQPFTASCGFLRGFVPDRTSPAIERLFRAGFIPIGRTNLPELALLGTTESALRGPARNPWDPSRSSGGSSGGSATAVASGVVSVAHGGDGGGSLRIPAAATGLVGLKATRGRISVAPDGEGWGGYVQWGVLTRTVRDTAALLDVMAGPEPGDPYAAPPAPGPYAAEVGRDPGRLRIAFSAGSLYGRAVDPAVAKAVRDVAAHLAAQGHDVEEATPKLDRDALVKAYLTQVAVGTAAEVETFRRWTGRTPRASDFEPATWFLVQVGRTIPALDLAKARDVVQEAGRTMAEFHARRDVFLTATTTYMTPKIGARDLPAADGIGLAALRWAPVPRVLRGVLDSLAEKALEFTPNTQLFNQTGQPAISLPLAHHEGLPIGLQFSGRMGEEHVLIRLAAALERSLPWSGRRPAI